MKIARRLDSEAIALQRQGQLGLYASCAGQRGSPGRRGVGTGLKVYDDLFHAVEHEPERDSVIDDVIAWMDHHVAGSSGIGATSAHRWRSRRPTSLPLPRVLVGRCRLGGG